MANDKPSTNGEQAGWTASRSEAGPNPVGNPSLPEHPERVAHYSSILPTSRFVK